MIAHVWRRAVEADVGPVLVAADEPAIIRVIETLGGRAILTRADHASGSDRIFEALNAFPDTAGTFIFTDRAPDPLAASDRLGQRPGAGKSSLVIGLDFTN